MLARLLNFVLAEPLANSENSADLLHLTVGERARRLVYSVGKEGLVGPGAMEGAARNSFVAPKKVLFHAWRFPSGARYPCVRVPCSYQATARLGHFD